MLETDRSILHEVRRWEAHLNNFWPQGGRRPFVFCDIIGREAENHTGQMGTARVGLESKYNTEEAKKLVRNVVMHACNDSFNTIIPHSLHHSLSVGGDCTGTHSYPQDQFQPNCSFDPLLSTEGGNQNPTDKAQSHWSGCENHNWEPRCETACMPAWSLQHWLVKLCFSCYKSFNKPSWIYTVVWFVESLYTPWSAWEQEYDQNLSLLILTTGSEYGIVLMSMVRSKQLKDITVCGTVKKQADIGWLRANLGFITDRHQICVGITRCKYGLVIVGKWQKKGNVQVSIYNYVPYLSFRQQGASQLRSNLE